MSKIYLEKKHDKHSPCTQCFLHGKTGKYYSMCAKSDCISGEYIFIQVEEPEVKNG